MALTAKENIFNLALAQIGDYEVEEGQTNTKEYLVCDKFYDNAYKRGLKSHPWNEAMKRAVVVQETYGPVYEFEYKYAVPSDSLRVLTISRDGLDEYIWEVEDGYIITDQAETPQTWTTGTKYTAGEYVNLDDTTYLCNVSNTASASNSPDTDAVTWTSQSASLKVIYVRYIYDNSDPSTYSEDLRNAVAQQLAILISPRLTNDVKTKNNLIQEMEQITMPKARSVDAQEGKPRSFYKSRWIKSRHFFRGWSP